MAGPLKSFIKIIFSWIQERSEKLKSMSTPANRRPDPPLSDSIWEMFSMKGKVVSITGGGGGIGYEVARAMAEAGADVAIW